MKRKGQSAFLGTIFANPLVLLLVVGIILAVLFGALDMISAGINGLTFGLFNVDLSAFLSTALFKGFALVLAGFILWITLRKIAEGIASKSFHLHPIPLGFTLFAAVMLVNFGLTGNIIPFEAGSPAAEQAAVVSGNLMDSALGSFIGALTVVFIAK